MGELIDLQAERAARKRRRDVGRPIVERLDHAIRQLETFLRDPKTKNARTSKVIEAELTTINRAVQDEDLETATEHAERLASRLSHASARIS